MLVLTAALALQVPWWDGAWTQRRALRVRNGSAEALEPGLPVELEIDPDFLGLRGKARPGLADLAVVRGGRRVPHVLRDDGRRLSLAFPLQARLEPGASDGAYALYYGNPAGAPPLESPFPLFEDFSQAAAFGIGGVRDGALEILKAAPGSTALAPERAVLKSGELPRAFTLGFDLEVPPGALASLGVAVDVELRGPAPTAEDLRRAAELIARLAADDFEQREQATAGLILLGEAAREGVQTAAESEDAEVRTRALQILADLRRKSPPRLIRAGLLCGDLLWRSASVGGAQATQGAARPGDGAARRFRFEIARDPEGQVTVSCDGQRLQRGRLEGEPGRVSIVAWRRQEGVGGGVRLDNLFARRYVDPEERPATTLEIEETRE